MARPILLLRTAALAVSLLSAACTAQNEMVNPPEPLGDFRLGYNVVVADNAQKVQPSRDATPEEWEALLTTAIDQRLRRYEGDKLYHIGVSVDGYALAVPGVPVVVAPKSALILSVNLWDDATQTKLTEKPQRLTVLESFTGETVIGTGLTKTREQQLDNLAFNAARAIERYLAQNAAAWFGETAPAPDAPEAEAGSVPDAPVAIPEVAAEILPPAPAAHPATAVN